MGGKTAAEDEGGGTGVLEGVVHEADTALSSVAFNCERSQPMPDPASPVPSTTSGAGSAKASGWRSSAIEISRKSRLLYRGSSEYEKTVGVSEVKGSPDTKSHARSEGSTRL